MVWGGPEACDRRTDEFGHNFPHRFLQPARSAQSVSLLIGVCARHLTVDKKGQTGRLHHLPRCRGFYERAHWCHDKRDLKASINARRFKKR